MRSGRRGRAWLGRRNVGVFGELETIYHDVRCRTTTTSMEERLCCVLNMNDSSMRLHINLVG